MSKGSHSHKIRVQAWQQQWTEIAELLCIQVHYAWHAFLGCRL